MKKLFTLLTMLLVGIGSSWGDNNPVVVTFGNSTPIEGLTTHAFNFQGAKNISQTLSDGTTLAFTPTNLFYWAGSDGNIEGSWTNSVAIEDINSELRTYTSFTAALFSANSSLKYLATGNQTSTSTLTLTFNNKQEGDRITLYASLARRGGSLSNFSASGLDGIKIQYAVLGGSGFSDTQAFSQRTGSSNDSPVTIVKITGKLSSSKTLTMSSTSAKNGWQMIAYRFNYYPHVTGSVANNDKNLGTIHVTRSHSISGVDKTLDIVTQTGTNPHSVYQNATNQTFTICAGQDIKVSYNQVGWMHAYMYIDYNNDGQFSPYTIQESGIPTEGSELVSYTYYNGKNSKGESANNSNSGTSLPVFTIPSDLAQGTYRARYKLDWDFLDPYGSDNSNRENNYTINNRGVIIDFIIQVVPKYTVTSDTKLSDIPDYDSYKAICVNKDVTLTVDIDDFDLANIFGAGNIILDADAPLSDNTVSGSLTVNSGKTLTVTAENFDLTKITIGSDATVEVTNSCYFPAVTNNGTLTIGGTLNTNGLTMNEGSTININSSINGATTVNGDATLNLTASEVILSQPITIASGKTLTIDGGESNATVTLNSLTNNGTVNFKNVTVTLNRSERDLSGYSFTNCTATLQFVETGAEYAAGGFTITNIPSGVTVKVKKYDGDAYETVTPEAGTATISHSVGVRRTAAWLDYTFNESTIESNTHDPADRVINNAGNAGISGNSLETDTGYNTDNSYNEDGTLKVMSTPYRSITWPTNYTVAVAGNVPDVENGCLVAFGSSTNGSKNYLAIIRGATQNEIKLVKGYGSSTFEVISTMAAANATALSHLVVFTKQGDNFDVYLDGVNVAHTTYSEALGGGFQIGSIHGGVPSGIVRVSAMSDATAKAKVFAKAVRVYDYVISDDQMSQLTTEFPYTSFGGKYTRTITENSNLSATGAWLNTDTQGNVDVPVNAIEDEVTYYPDVEITTTAASTLTVNADMDVENIVFKGAGKLTIASDGTHHINIYGSVTANGPVSVKYGEIDLSAVPVSIGESGSVEFDFSASDFSGVTTSTDYPITGNTSDYGNKVTGVYPSDIYHTFTITHKSTTNSYYLTVGPSVALKRQQAIDLVTPYYNGRYVGTGLGKYTISLGETSYAEMADFGTAVMSWQTLEDCVEPTISLNMPANGFYRIKSQNNGLKPENVGKYLHNNLEDGGLALNTTKDETTIFYVDCENNRILSYADGKYLYYWDQAPTVGNPGTWTIMEGSEIGKYAIKIGSSNWYASDWNTTDHITNGNKDANALWAIEAVDELPLTLSEGGYTSFSAPVPIVIPEDNGEDKADYYAYYATSQDNDAGVINMRRVTGNVPAYTGLIIYTKIDNPTIQIAENSTSLEYTNLLVANVAASNVSRTDNYFFGKVSGKYVFTQLSGTGDYLLPGHKAYLNLSSGGARMSINWGVDNPTGLSELRDENIKLSDGKYYQNGRVVIVRNGVKYNVAGQTIK